VIAPSEGDLIEIDVDSPSTGHGGRGRRPALVVSIPRFQETGLALVCPVTTHAGKATKARTELEVAIPPGCKVSGFILSHHWRSVDWKARNAAVLDHLPRATLLQVRARLKLFLGI
jgi:mRNA-degrading endonuclease toxin of MazEF toxin-antitoxin module